MNAPNELNNVDVAARDLLCDICNVLMPELNPELIIFIQ